MHTHARLWCTVILMWFHLHARDPFVFIIIIRLEEADLLGLVETAMPLCLEIKNNFTAWTFVMSPQHRIGDIKREIVLCTLKKKPISVISRKRAEILTDGFAYRAVKGVCLWSAFLCQHFV